jgi:membrane protein implicated in regulation of membrane protease activity
MSDSRPAQSGGIGLLGALFLLFTCLKLTGHIDWSWWWVTAPLWGGFALFVAIVAAVFAFVGIGVLFVWIAERVSDGYRDRRRAKLARKRQADELAKKLERLVMK